MYSVSKEIHFCYGHRLLHHQGKCAHLHGHNARAVIRLESENLDALGMVCDFADIGRFVKECLDREIVLPLLQQAAERVYMMETNPTAENIARLIFEHVEKAGFPVVEVALYETESAFASYAKT